MKKFWNYISSGEYSAGCTGSTVFLYSKDGNELAQFKDLTHAYKLAFSPASDILAVKSIEGFMAIYSPSERRLIKKFKFSKIRYGQNHNFCFTCDGKLLYNIESPTNECVNQISIYDTTDFSFKKQILNEDENLMVTSLEYDSESDRIYVLGFYRIISNNTPTAWEYWVAYLDNDKLEGIKRISEKEHDCYCNFMDLKDSGFTEKQKKWCTYLEQYGYDVDSVEKENHSLAELWKKH